MRKIAALALAAVAAACSSEEKKIQWSDPRSPTTAEQTAAADAATMLQSSLGYQASTEPSAGAAGLGDQLAATFQTASPAPGIAKATSPSKVAQSATRQAIDAAGIDPACVTPVTDGAGVTTYTWSGCVVDDSSTDPYTGETTTLHVTVDGWLSWNPALGQTRWQIDQSMSMTARSPTESTSMSESGRLAGTWTVTDATIVGDTSSTAHVAMSMQSPSGGFAFEGDTATTLTARLDYVVPFAITGGTLQVVQQVDAYGQKQFQGWELTWTGPDQFRIRTGT